MTNNAVLERIDNITRDDIRPTAVHCRCGYKRGDLQIRANLAYSLMSLFGLLSFGHSSVPKRVDWKCITCNEIVETITEPLELKRYRYRIPRN